MNLAAYTGLQYVVVVCNTALLLFSLPSDNPVQFIETSDSEAAISLRPTGCYVKKKIQFHRNKTTPTPREVCFHNYVHFFFR
jgi:hypothetical protein